MGCTDNDQVIKGLALGTSSDGHVVVVAVIRGVRKTLLVAQVSVLLAFLADVGLASVHVHAAVLDGPRGADSSVSPAREHELVLFIASQIPVVRAVRGSTELFIDRLTAIARVTER